MSKTHRKTERQLEDTKKTPQNDNIHSGERGRGGKKEDGGMT